jgi:hypothetical protein
LFYLTDNDGLIVAASAKNVFAVTVEENGGQVVEIKNGPENPQNKMIRNGRVVDAPKMPDDIRSEREVLFSRTIDRMNPFWLEVMTDSQSSRLKIWRQEWLDYPSTGVEPQTDVSDIFPEA